MLNAQVFVEPGPEARPVVQGIHRAGLWIRDYVLAMIGCIMPIILHMKQLDVEIVFQGERPLIRECNDAKR